MVKKLLALFMAMCMVFSICAIGVSAEGATNEDTEGGENAVENSVELELANSYLPNGTIVIKGTATGDVTGVIVKLTCDDDDYDEEKTVNVSDFEAGKVKFVLEDATVGAEYVVEVYNFADASEKLAEESFLIRKGSYSANDDGSNAVTIWIEGNTNRYIDKTVVNLDWVKKPTVLEVAKYVLNEADRSFKSTKKKITAIASSPTGSTYTLKDDSSSSYFEDCQWAYILNGETADYDGDWTDVELKGGSEIVLFYGEPGVVGYPVISIEPDVIGVKDEVVVTVKNRVFEEDGSYNEVIAEDAKVALMKRGATTKTTGKAVNDDGQYIVKSSSVTSSWITSYQGGKVMVTGYGTSKKAIQMVSGTADLKTDREGAVQAYVRIEGAHKTLLARTKSAKIEEYDLYSFMVEVLEDKKIDYETDDDETYFTYFESKSTSGYSNENGDITRDSGWYVALNDEIIKPETDLEEIEVYPNDEILFYFGDSDTVPVVYYKVDGELETDKKVYVYFYSDADMTRPIEDLEVNFEGDDINKSVETDDEGKIKLPTVEYKGTYTLSWGEQVSVKDDECPSAVKGSVELKFTGTSNPDGKEDEEEDEKKTYECEYCDDEVTRVYSVKYNNKYIDVCKSCKSEIEAEAKKEAEEDEDEWESTKPNNDKDVTGWDDGDFDSTKKDEDKVDFVPGPSKYYPDKNIDAWAVANINKAHEYDLMSGTAQGYFEPKREITRAEFTTIVCRILGLDTEATYAAKFTDVKSTDWYYKYVMAAHQAGYVNGMSATTFAPNNYITREEIAVMVSRILNIKGSENDVYKFTDGTSVAAWARIYVAAVNQTGIMTGDQFNQFLPKNKVDRQTVATVAVRLYEYLGNN